MLALAQQDPRMTVIDEYGGGIAVKYVPEADKPAPK